ncbi:MAG TPA: dihydrodipicolinate synthase family protein [Tepidisphaeraceae bacterium]
MPETKYCGVVVPMISPFTSAGAVDVAAVGRIVDHLIAGGIGGIFPLGTTGEAASIHPDDKRKLAEATVQRVNKRAMVYVGIAGNCFRESVDAANDYKHIGADAVVAHMPSYYPLSDSEIEQYFLRLADSVPLPLVLYNIPVTTHHQIALGVVDRLSKHPNIVAMKDSANDPKRLTELLAMTGGRGGFPVLLGSSAQFTHGLKNGGVGIVPSGGHLVPNEYQAMYVAAMNKQWNEVERLQRVTDEACAAYLRGRSLGEGLAMLKVLLEQKGLCERTMLPPLRTVS